MTYAKSWIKKYITKYIEDNKSSIRVPKSVLDDIKKYNNKKEEQSLKLSREPNIKEMANAMNLSESSLKSIEYQIYKQRILSLNSPIGEEQTDELMDFVSSDEKNPEEILIDLDLKHKLVDLLLNKCKLTSRQVEVLMLYFGLKDGCCRKEIEVAKICNITIERVRQVMAKALLKIRNSEYIKELAAYMSRPDEALENIESGSHEEIKISKL